MASQTENRLACLFISSARFHFVSLQKLNVSSICDKLHNFLSKGSVSYVQHFLSPTPTNLLLLVLRSLPVDKEGATASGLFDTVQKGSPAYIVQVRRLHLAMVCNNFRGLVPQLHFPRNYLLCFEGLKCWREQSL